MEFKDKVALISGAGRGAGRRLAEAFAHAGASLALNDISPQNVETLAAALQARGTHVNVFIEDVAKKVGAQALVKQAEDAFGKIDILINHASVEPRAPLLDMDEWDWHRVLDVNLTGAFLMMQSAGRIMRAGGGGVIVNVASLPAEADSSERSAYVAGAYGLIGLTRQAARELFAHNIRVHAIGGGLGQFQTTTAAIPADPTRAALFLCGPRAARLTGQILNLS
ncbi:MAG: 3-alpha-hydroxycholanate dehydrogenase (NADP(+)) [Anaerolineales bacterium]|nr:3-alpha-hydroxycholanate dehydrogenase (NADP(+)) [Anaerolineales bacterium]